MTLDLFQTVPQIEAMSAELKAERSRHQQQLQEALELLGSALDVQALKRKIETGKTTWLVAGLESGLGERFPLPPTPPDFYVVATDGSHIDIDRHRTASCYLINVGLVALRYGENAQAHLSNLPRLYSSKEEMVLSLPLSGNRSEPLRGELLGVKRGAEECRRLCDLVRQRAEPSPTLALLDGSLILWGLTGGAYPEAVVQELLETGLLACLGELQQLAEKGPLGVGSYISFPGNTEVVNALRVAVCPREPVDCDRCSREGKEKECERMAGLRDRDLFAGLLKPGERSPMFYSRSSIVRRYYGRHEVCFFYLNVEDEIARVEVPRWVVNMGLIDLTHALVYDQCRRGQGYPVVLSEAHEQAVLTGADRERFWEMVEETMVKEGMEIKGSAKSDSKRTRWI
ncbi:MAG: DNA double-strand break repair nuclease NurA [Dehalococcoidia bacterium]|nr:DNA double-strand break repair nuclease NurA [Dehalococcoidia bacterium]